MPSDERNKVDARKIESSNESLFFILEQFSDQSSHCDQRVGRKLQETLRFLERKFRAEAQILERMGQPERQAHAADHEGIVRRIQDVIDTSACGDDRIPRMFRVVEIWTRAHVEHYDRPLIEQLRTSRRRVETAERQTFESC